MSNDLSALGWELEVDTPATIAILGGGMLAVEAALYARFLGYAVLLLDDAKVGDELLVWGDTPMLNADGEPANWQDVTTPLGLAALEAQHGKVELPEGNLRVTHREYVQKYLLPVARTDLIYDSVQIHSPVLSISRHGCDEWDSCSLEDRSEMLFRILINGHNRGEYSQLFDVVLDCTTRPAGRRGLASGGGLAIGELEHTAAMLTGKIHVLDKHRSQLIGKHCLLFGNDLDACANAIELFKLAEQSPGTRCTWIVPKRLGVKGLSLPSLESAGSSVIADILERAHQLATADDPRMVVMGAWGIEALTRSTQEDAPESPWHVRLQTRTEETLDLSGDVFINCSKARRRHSYVDQLNVAPLDGVNTNGDWPLTCEPHYYRLGTSEHARWAGVLTPPMLQQIRAAFALIGGRRELDLYATVKPSGN